MEISKIKNKILKILLYQNYRKSFTLVELLIVILIIGVLAAVIAPRMVTLDRKAKEAATKRNLAALKAAINFYKADHGFFPFYKYKGIAEDGSAYLGINKSEHDNNDLVPNYIAKIPSVFLGQRDTWGVAGDGRYHEGDSDFLIIGPQHWTIFWYGRAGQQGWSAEYIYCYETGEIWINACKDNDNNEGSYLKGTNNESIIWW